MFKLAWKALEHSVVYQSFIDIIGGEAFRRSLASNLVMAKPGDHVLDIGCGPADWLELLPEVKYVGLDSNPKYIEAANRRFGDQGTFEVATVSDNLAGKFRDFDIVLAMGVIHHLNDLEASQLLQLASDALRPGGRFITLDGVFINGQPTIEHWVVSRDRGRFVRTKPEYEQLCKSYFPEVCSKIYQGELKIPYSHLTMCCT